MAKSSDNIRCIRKYPKKDGTFSFHAEVRRKGAKPIRQVFRTLTEAKNWVRSNETGILEGKLPQEVKARKYTVNDLIEQYETIYLNRFPKRVRSQVHHLAWWREHYGHKLLSDVKPSLLAQAKHSLLSENTIRKTPRSGPTVNRYFAKLSKAFSLASSEWEWIAENPFRKVSKLPENKGRSRFLSKEELQLLLQACKEHKNRNLYGMVLMAESLGMRYGEIASLKWKNVDFEHRLITLEVTKNHDIRVLPMPDQIYNFLKGWSTSNQEEDYIFPSQNPSREPTYTMIRKAFQSVFNQLGFKDIVFHSLRHTAASHLAMSGATQGEEVASKNQ
ncbi:MAG: site-specific integrase [Candidatus Protochlamydia sp.]|nr:site-specific integrase [Candidatus Protochlamydia sp.]